MTAPHWRQTGGVWPLGISTSMTWLDIGALLTLITLSKAQRVLEIGVEHGGCSVLLATYCRYAARKIEYRGIDICLNALSSTITEDDPIDLLERDAWASKTITEMRAWLAASPGPRLIFCDGGDKPRDLHAYAPLLKAGDVIVAHDYMNEYNDDALADLPPHLERVRADWLDETLLCAFRCGDV